jgi:hypothetical protein
MQGFLDLHPPPCRRERLAAMWRSRMKTSCWYTYAGKGQRIGISRGPAKGAGRGYRLYKTLAPGPWFHSVEYQEYYQLYMEQLSKLDSEQVYDDLKRLAAPLEPILLCFEEPPLHRENWCHRSLVARWFKQTLGLEVREYCHGVHRSPHWKKVPPRTVRLSSG